MKMESTTTGNLNTATPAQVAPVVQQPEYANPAQPPPAPVIVYGSPYYAQGPGVPYVAQPPPNNNKKIWILAGAAIACCILFFVLPSLIASLAFSSLHSRDEPKTETVVEGVMYGNQLGVFLVSLPSLEKKQIASEPAHSVAFDWKSRKVYWINGSRGAAKRANLDGTDVEDLAGGARVDKLAVDWITGNVYYLKASTGQLTHDIRVCSKSRHQCSNIVTDQIKPEGIALHPAKSLMFWTSFTYTARAKMNGNDARVILSKNVSHIAVDEDSDRLYWVEGSRSQIKSCDFNGDNETLHLNDATGGLFGLAVHGDLIYFGNNIEESLQSVDKDGGNRKVLANATGGAYDIALYGKKTHLPDNPCENLPCLNLCVLDGDSYACLDPLV